MTTTIDNGLVPIVDPVILVAVSGGSGDVLLPVANATNPGWPPPPPK